MTTRLPPKAMSKYQMLMVLLIVLLLFTIVVDYMLLSALSAILMPTLDLGTEQFGIVASAYGISAAVSSFLSIGFADRFDRKKYLLFFYLGFVAGILGCALAQSYEALLAARVVSGLFGGIVGATCLAIIADLFKANQRGRVMGFVQMSYATGQVGGLPLAMYAADAFSWQTPYWAIAALAGTLGLLLLLYMKPLKQHLRHDTENQPLHKLIQVVAKKAHWNVFLNNSFLVAGDALILTFDATFMAENLELSMDKVPLIYMITGGVTLVFGPLLGRLADKIGKWRVFSYGTLLSVTSILLYTNMSQASFVMIILIHTLLFIGINARMISSTSLGMAVPAVKDRGAFMAFDSSVQQLAAALAALSAGFVIVKTEAGIIERYPLLGILVTAFMLSTLFFMLQIHRQVEKTSSS